MTSMTTSTSVHPAVDWVARTTTGLKVLRMTAPMALTAKQAQLAQLAQLIRLIRLIRFKFATLNLEA